MRAFSSASHSGRFEERETKACGTWAVTSGCPNPTNSRPAGPSHLSESPVRATCPSHLSESPVRVTCPSHLSEYRAVTCQCCHGTHLSERQRGIEPLDLRSFWQRLAFAQFRAPAPPGAVRESWGAAAVDQILRVTNLAFQVFRRLPLGPCEGQGCVHDSPLTLCWR
jgi:hypothetical protein